LNGEGFRGETNPSHSSEIDNPTGDPIDRLIVATAQAEDAVLLTADGSLLDWPGQVRRHDAQR
jgi:PIN domain nuclease of toxin-antitoxin system